QLERYRIGPDIGGNGRQRGRDHGRIHLFHEQGDRENQRGDTDDRHFRLGIGGQNRTAPALWSALTQLAIGHSTATSGQTPLLCHGERVLSSRKNCKASLHGRGAPPLCKAEPQCYSPSPT